MHRYMYLGFIYQGAPGAAVANNPAEEVLPARAALFELELPRLKIDLKYTVAIDPPNGRPTGLLVRLTGPGLWQALSTRVDYT